MDGEKVVHWSILVHHREPEKYSLAIARHRQVLRFHVRVDVEKTDADGTGARPPHRLLVSLRVPREHVGFW